MSHILHGFTDPNYLNVLIEKTRKQILEAENEADRQRFSAYLDVLNGWQDKMRESREQGAEPNG